mgnify:CR=1 FL=1
MTLVDFAIAQGIPVIGDTDWWLIRGLRRYVTFSRRPTSAELSTVRAWMVQDGDLVAGVSSWEDPGPSGSWRYEFRTSDYDPSRG